MKKWFEVEAIIKKEKITIVNLDFKEIAPVANPLHPWILREGRIPVKA